MNQALSDKLEQILNSIENLTKKLDKLDTTVKALDCRLDKIENKFNGNFLELETCIKSKTDRDGIEELNEKLLKLEKSINKYKNRKPL